jgi:hypothetical protein
MKCLEVVVNISGQRTAGNVRAAVEREAALVIDGKLEAERDARRVRWNGELHLIVVVANRLVGDTGTIVRVDPVAAGGGRQP